MNPVVRHSLTVWAQFTLDLHYIIKAQILTSSSTCNFAAFYPHTLLTFHHYRQALLKSVLELSSHSNKIIGKICTQLLQPRAPGIFFLEEELYAQLSEDISQSTLDKRHSSSIWLSSTIYDA